MEGILSYIASLSKPGLNKTLSQKQNNRANNNDKTMKIKHPTLTFHCIPARRQRCEQKGALPGAVGVWASSVTVERNPAQCCGGVG